MRILIGLDFEKEGKKAWKDKTHPDGWEKREKEAGKGTGKFEGRSIKEGKRHGSGRANLNGTIGVFSVGRGQLLQYVN